MKGTFDRCSPGPRPTWVSPNGRWRVFILHGFETERIASSKAVAQVLAVGADGTEYLNGIYADGRIAHDRTVSKPMPGYVADAVDDILRRQRTRVLDSESSRTVPSRNPRYQKKRSEGEHLYVAVDEKGNLGQSRKHERYYNVVATVVNDKDAFEDVSRPYFEDKGREIKYYLDDDLHEPIIKKAAPYVEDTYYARYHKDPKTHRKGLDKEEKIDKHMDMLCSVADAILSKDGFKSMDVDIDYNELVKSQPVEASFICSPYKDGKCVKCKVDDSAVNYGLMTHDFITGAVGDFANDKSNQEAKKLVSLLPRKPIEVHIRDRLWRIRGGSQ